MATINGLTTLAIADVVSSDYLPIYDASAATDKKTPLFEQSTWTPVVRFNGGATGVTYSARTAYYVRMGPVVYVVADIRLSSKGAYTTESADIAALPITSGNNPNSIISVRWVTTASSYVYMVGVIPSSDSTIDLYGITAAATTIGAVTANGLGNSAILQISGFYFA